MIKDLVLCRFLCLAIIFFLYPCSLAYAQTTITGTITDKTTHEKLAGVTVIIKGRTIGASTNGDGKFILNTSLKLPLTISVNYVGYTPYEQEVSSSADISITLEQAPLLGQEIVIAASRALSR